MEAIISNQNRKYLGWGLLAFLGIIAYALTQGSVFPQGDDLAHLVTDRAFPVPERWIWISNRVIDGFFNAYFFQLFQILYDIFPGLGAARDFVDLYRAYNALVYSVFVIAAVSLTNLTVREFVGKGSFELLVTSLLAFCAVLRWMPPNVGSTFLFAYQVTAVITLAFLLLAYPPFRFESAARDELAREPLSRPRYVLLSLLAYLTAVGLEAFVVFAWLYIAAYYAALFTVHLRSSPARRDMRSILRSMSPSGLQTHTITLQFLLYSVWSLYALTTSGRTRIGLTPGAELVSWYRFPALDMASIRSSGAHLLALVLISCIGYALLRRIGNRGSRVARDRLFAPTTLLSLFVFSSVLGFGYLGGLVALGDIASINYVNDPKFIFPLKFVLLTLLLALLLPLVGLFRNALLEGVAVVGLFVYCTAIVAEQMMQAGKERVAAERIRKAFRAAAVAPDNFVSVPFVLPNIIPNNEGYPLLPAGKAAEWYRTSYRLMLNKYYKANFDNFGPIFYTKDDAAASGPPRWPMGTSVSASSIATGTGSFDPGFVIDGDLSTYWADNTPRAYPDVAIIASPKPVSLPGITVVSHEHGRLLDFTVETWDGKGWVLQKTIVNAGSLITPVKFDAPVQTTQVRLTVTRDEASRLGEYTRVAEVVPYVVSEIPR